MTSNLRLAACAASVLALAASVLASCKGQSLQLSLAGTAAAREDFPATDSMLSLLEPSDAQCVWSKVDVISQKRLEISKFDGDCRGGKIALSADGRRGAVWFDPGATGGSLFGGVSAFPEPPAPAGTRPRLFEVDLGTGAATAVPLPSGMRDLGFDSQGRMIALTLQELTENETEKGEALVDGKLVKLEPASQGDPVLVHAFSFEHDTWKRLETANSTTTWDLGLGVYALKAAQDLAFRSGEVLAPKVQGDDEVDAALLTNLARFAPQALPVEGGGGWIRFGSHDTRFVLWEDGGDFAYSTGLAAFVDPSGNLLKPPSGWPFTENDLLAYRWKGPYLLAAQSEIGAHPRLFRNGKLVWSSDIVRAVTFWPRQHRAEG